MRSGSPKRKAKKQVQPKKPGTGAQALTKVTGRPSTAVSRKQANKSAQGKSSAVNEQPGRRTGQGVSAVRSVNGAQPSLAPPPQLQEAASGFGGMRSGNKTTAIASIPAGPGEPLRPSSASNLNVIETRGVQKPSHIAAGCGAPTTLKPEAPSPSLIKPSCDSNCTSQLPRSNIVGAAGNSLVRGLGMGMSRGAGLHPATSAMSRAAGTGAPASTSSTLPKPAVGDGTSHGSTAPGLVRVHTPLGAMLGGPAFRVPGLRKPGARKPGGHTPA